jgi:hypothetical protein
MGPLISKRPEQVEITNYQGGPATMKRYPREIKDHDLIVCLLAIDRILDFWFWFRENINETK